MSEIIVVKKEDLEEVINTLEEALAMVDDPLAPRDSLVSTINYAYSRLREIISKGEIGTSNIEELKKKIPEIREKNESLASLLEWVIGVFEVLGYTKPLERGVKQ
jgi:hypothetical protein